MAAKNDGYIRWRCKSCGQKLKVKDTYEGGSVIQCPRCRATVNVPMGNIEAIAAGADIPETGTPGRLQIDPKKLKEALEGGKKSVGPGSAGSTPSVRWDSQAAFARIEQLDHLVAAAAKIDQDVMGQFQRLFRSTDLSPERRRELAEDAARGRREELGRLVANRLTGIRFQLDPLEGARNLNRSELTTRERLQRAIEAIELYSRYVLGLDV
jgi:hypothetical protein